LIAKLLSLLIITSHLFFVSNVFSQNEFFEIIHSEKTEKDTSAVSFFVRFYQRFISVFDGDRCPMYPSCSQYSLQCFKKHGFLLGWIMTCDRLLHEPDEIGRAPVIIVDGRTLYFDPVEENDQWLKGINRKTEALK